MTRSEAGKAMKDSDTQNVHNKLKTSQKAGEKNATKSQVPKSVISKMVEAKTALTMEGVSTNVSEKNQKLKPEHPKKNSVLGVFFHRYLIHDLGSNYFTMHYRNSAPKLRQCQSSSKRLKKMTDLRVSFSCPKLPFKTCRSIIGI